MAYVFSVSAWSSRTARGLCRSSAVENMLRVTQVLHLQPRITDPVSDPTNIEALDLR